MAEHERHEWHGDEIETRAERALGRAVISWGEQIASEAKQIVHVQSGDLRRSIHTAKRDEMHFDDEELCKTEDIPSVHDWREVESDFLATVEVGSWLAYACVEETGRGHVYMLPAHEMVTPTLPVTMRTAFAEEGLDTPGSLGTSSRRG